MSETMIKAFIKVQEGLPDVKAEAKNPFFKSDYVTFDALMKIVKPILLKNGFAIVQNTTGSNGYVEVETILYHESGAKLESGKLPIKPEKETPQQYCSAITYAKRYSLMAFLGIAHKGEDDDGNASSGGSKGGKGGSKPTGASSTPPTPTLTEVIKWIKDAPDMTALKDVYARGATFFTKQADKDAVIDAKNERKAQLEGK